MIKQGLLVAFGMLFMGSATMVPSVMGTNQEQRTLKLENLKKDIENLKQLYIHYNFTTLTQERARRLDEIRQQLQAMETEVIDMGVSSRNVVIEQGNRWKAEYAPSVFNKSGNVTSFEYSFAHAKEATTISKLCEEGSNMAEYISREKERLKRIEDRK